MAMTGTLLIKCPDSKGVVASVAQVRGTGWILRAQQPSS